jgi:hypothetical protein
VGLTNRSTCCARHIMCSHICIIFKTHFCCLLPLLMCLQCPRCPPCPHTISLYLLLYYILMSAISPPFNWSKWLKYNWYSIKGIEKLQRLVGPSLSYTQISFSSGAWQELWMARMFSAWVLQGMVNQLWFTFHPLCRKAQLHWSFALQIFSSDLVSD